MSRANLGRPRRWRHYWSYATLRRPAVPQRDEIPIQLRASFFLALKIRHCTVPIGIAFVEAIS
jgi:hypothetical protein